jgi:putative membrane protein
VNSVKLTIAALSVVVAAPLSAQTTAKFLNDAVQGDRSESTLGTIIHHRGHDPSVRSFGATLVDDHTRAHAQVAALARRLHIPLADKVMPEARSEMSKLSNLKGRAFDREVRRYMIEDHRKDIAEFRAQAQNGDQPTAALAKQTLPVLEKHLRLAEALPN